MSSLLENMLASLQNIARFQNKQNADHALHPSDASRDQVELVEEEEPEVVLGDSSSESNDQSETDEQSPSSSASQSSSQHSPLDARAHDAFWTSSSKSNDSDKC
jgi:hypothetical protein